MGLLYLPMLLLFIMSTFCLKSSSSSSNEAAQSKAASLEFVEKLKSAVCGCDKSNEYVQHKIDQVVSFVVLNKVKQYRQDAQAVFESMPSVLQKFHALQEKKAWIDAWRVSSKITPLNNCNYDYFELAVLENDKQESNSDEIQLYVRHRYDKAKLTEKSVHKWFLDRDLVINKEQYDRNESYVDCVSQDRFIGRILDMLSQCQLDTVGIASVDFFKKCVQNLLENAPEEKMESVKSEEVQ